MSESAFNRALSNFTYEVACKRGIRHLYDLGYDVDSILKELSYPAKRETVEREIKEYREEKEKQAAGAKVPTYVSETDELGRSTFRRVET